MEPGAPTPRKIGPYEVEGLLGEGGIGQVYAARDTLLGRPVAIKMLRPEMARDRKLIERFYVEAKSLGQLNHPNITTLHALQLEAQEAYMVMELINGRTVNDLLARVRRLSMRESLAVVAQAAAGLSYAHRRGIIHRDIKPSNLMVTDEGVLKIMDFGVARVLGSQQLTRTGEFYGTLAYASPEQIRGDTIDERSDLYSLAIVLYRMLTGAPPFAANSDYGLMTAQLQNPPPPLREHVPDLDIAIEPVLMRALAKEPDERFATVEEFGRAVGAAALRGEAVEILQQLYADTVGNSDATRILDRKLAPEPERIAVPRPASGAYSRRRPLQRAPQPGAAWRIAPLTAGAVILAIAAGGAGYAFLWPNPGHHRVVNEASAPAASAPAQPSETPPAASDASAPAGGVASSPAAATETSNKETPAPIERNAAAADRVAAAAPSETAGSASGTGDQPSPSSSAATASPPPVPEPPKHALPTLEEAAVAPPPPVTRSPADDEALWSTEEKREVQRGLHTLGHFQGEPDGEFGLRTRAAIQQFQSFADEKETGILTADQRTALLGMAQRLTALLQDPATSPKGVSASAIRAGAQRYARAWSFETGKGNAADPAEAVYWYRLAAADGEARALTNLGTLMARGHGIAHADPEAARLLWWAAAAHGETIAMFNLGAMYEHGIGVAADIANARRWYERAALHNHPQARAALTRLGS